MDSITSKVMALKASNPTLIVNKDGRWDQYHMNELYKGNDTDPVARYVPKVDDLVFDPKTGFWLVTYVDYSTGLSTLKAWYAPDDTSGGEGDDNITVGVVPGNGRYIYWCFINTNVTPHTLCLDRRLYFHGSSAKDVKVFKGTNISDTGTVISAFYNVAGDLEGENIPLELTAVTDATNITTKNAVVGWAKMGLQSGEVVSVVVYDEAGNVGAKVECLVQNTEFVRASESSQKHITGIRLDSPFLSDTEKNVLHYPINMPLDSMVVSGIVSFSDGENRRVPIDGKKMSIYGTENYVASIVGQRLPLVLTYHLSSDEAAYASQTGATQHISELYEAVSREVDGAYSVKLFVVPWWSTTLHVWRLEYFLATLDRTDLFRVTDLVEPGTNTSPFNPSLYGTVQELSVVIDLNKVDPAFKQWRHPQRFSLVLNGPGTSRQYPWMIEYTPGQTEWYGKNLEAVFTFTTVNASSFTIDCGAPTQDEWLERLYYNAKPIYLSQEEVRAPRPTHMRFLMGKDGSMAHSFKTHINNWSSEITSPYFPENGDSVFIEWTNEESGTPLFLARTGLPVRRIFTTP